MARCREQNPENRLRLDDGAAFRTLEQRPDADDETLLIPIRVRVTDDWQPGHSPACRPPADAGRTRYHPIGQRAAGDCGGKRPPAGRSAETRGPRADDWRDFRKTQPDHQPGKHPANRRAGAQPGAGRFAGLHPAQEQPQTGEKRIAYDETMEIPLPAGLPGR